MNASQLLIAGVFASMAAVGAQAGEASPTSAHVFHSTVPAAQVRAGAVAAAHNPQSGEAGISYARATPVLHSDLTRAAVRAEALIAQRSGTIAHGEAM